MNTNTNTNTNTIDLSPEALEGFVNQAAHDLLKRDWEAEHQMQHGVDLFARSREVLKEAREDGITAKRLKARAASALDEGEYTRADVLLEEVFLLNGCQDNAILQVQDMRFRADELMSAGRMVDLLREDLCLEYTGDENHIPLIDWAREWEAKDLYNR